MWIQTLTRLEDQGLWIQAIAFHYLCAKAVSSTHFFRRWLWDPPHQNGLFYLFRRCLWSWPMDLISTIHLVAPKETNSPPLIQRNILT